MSQLILHDCLFSRLTRAIYFYCFFLIGVARLNISTSYKIYGVSNCRCNYYGASKIWFLEYRYSKLIIALLVLENRFSH